MVLNYYADMKDEPLSDLSRQANIKTNKKFMAFSYSSCQDFSDTGRITWAYVIFYQGCTIDHGTHFPGPVSQSSAESEYNVAVTAGMALEHFRMLIYELLNKDIDIVPEESPLNILDSKYDFCMAKNGKDTNNTTHISRRVHFVSNGEKYKMYNIDWCGGGLKLADIAT